MDILKLIILCVAGLSLGLVLLFVFAPFFDPVINDELAQPLSECLKYEGAVMYGTYWCGYCNDQKKLFGQYFDNVQFVDCAIDNQPCLQAGISGYPTWVINGQKFPGQRSLENLNEISGCSG